MKQNIIDFINLQRGSIDNDDLEEHYKNEGYNEALEIILEHIETNYQ